MPDNSEHSLEYEVFLVGRYFCDLVFTDLPEFPRLGHEVYSGSFNLVPGGVYTPAVALHRLGIKTAWPCRFGSDPFSRYVKEQAVNEGIDSTFFEDNSSPSLRITAAFSFENERAFLSYTDQLPKYSYGKLIRDSCPEWLYITHLVLGDELDGLVGAARSVGAKIYMDCQAHNHSLDDPNIKDALRKVDLFSPNADEARTLTGKKELKNALVELSSYVPAVIIKDGSCGCHYQDSNENIHEEGITVDMVDTTGAGDNFNSGFLLGQVRGYSVRNSLRIANICGGLSIEGYGGTASSPTEVAIMEML
jgi:sugar/nucleoside kinase (ribokinase family)